MAWISIHDTVLGAKLRDLSKKTGESKAECLGSLNVLWLWGLTNADEDGMILKADEADLADVLHGNTLHDPRIMVEAMIATGWIDKFGNTLSFHDWSDWQELWYKHQKKKERDRASYLRKTYGDDGDGQPPGGDGQPAEETYSPEFEELWKYYPRKVTKEASYKKYLARIREGWSHEKLLEATIAYSAEVKRKGTKSEYIKHGETFFGPNRPFKDYLRDKPAKDAEPEDTGNPFAKYKGDS